MSSTQRIGVFGGTFDPIHVGHLVAIEEVVYKLGLSCALFVPNRVPPHKSQERVSPVEDRVTMVRLAIASNPHFALSTVEIDRPGPSYTLDTMRCLQRQYGEHTHLFFIMGLDALASLPSWHEPATLLEEFDIVVMDRPPSSEAVELPAQQARDTVWQELEHLFPNIRQRVQIVHVPQLAISAASLRRRVYEGWPIRYLVPPEVEIYITARGLYRERN
jgi:nicotinate-nucleotide adenylyltransferase